MALSFIGGGNRRARKKNNDLSQVTDKLYYIMLYTSPLSRFELTTSVVIGTDCKGSCKSNFHTITATALLNKQMLSKIAVGTEAVLLRQCYYE
jgi:hypothetical protein